MTDEARHFWQQMADYIEKRIGVMELHYKDEE